MISYRAIIMISVVLLILGLMMGMAAAAAIMGWSILDMSPIAQIVLFVIFGTALSIGAFYYLSH